MERRIIMVEQPTESKNIVWYFPMIGKTTLPEADDSIALSMLFYRNYDDMFPAIVGNGYKFVTSNIEMQLDDFKFNQEILDLAIETYENKVKHKGVFEYLLLSNKYIIKIDDLKTDFVK